MAHKKLDFYIDSAIKNPIKLYQKFYDKLFLQIQYVKDEFILIGKRQCQSKDSSNIKRNI